jgi:hypothetical protein
MLVVVMLLAAVDMKFLKHFGGDAGGGRYDLGRNDPENQFNSLFN